MSRLVLAGALALLCSAPFAQAAPDLALVLNGNDNTLSTVETGPGLSHTGVHTFSGYPGHGTLESGRYYVAVSGADRVLVFDAATLAPVDTLFPGAGSNPFAVCGDGAGNVFVSLLLADEVVRYDATGAETARAAVGRAPQGVLVHQGRLFVADTGFDFGTFGYDPGMIHALDPATLAPLGTIPVGLNPQWLAPHGTEVHAVCTGNYFSVFGEVHVADAIALAPLDTVTVGGSPGFLTVGGGRGYATDYFGGIYVYDAATRAVLHDAGSPWLVGGSGYSGSAWDGAGHLYVALYDDDLVAKLRVSDETVADAWPTGDGPGSVVLRFAEPVPVRLARLEAAARDGAVTLTWTLAAADGVAGFRVDRRETGAWIAVGTADAAERVFTDASPAAGTSAYRLTAVLRDGAWQVLGETRVAVPAPAFAVRVLANPARDRLLLRTAGAAAGPVTVRLVDASGRVALAAEVVGDAPVPLGSVPAGVYFVIAEQPDRRAATRVTVVR